MECLPCEKKFTGPESYEQHLESEKHRKKIMNIQERPEDSDNSSISFSSKLHEAIKCDVCDLSFDSFGSFQNHSLTPEHALKVMLKQTKIKETPNPSCAISNQQFLTNQCKVDSTTEEKILPELNYKSSSFSYFRNCEVCSKMFSGPEPYKQHIESQAHLKKALQQNATSVGGNLSSLKCEPCSKCFSGQVPFIQHMSSETHKKKLQNIQFVEKYLTGIDSSYSKAEENGLVVPKENENKPWFCNICNIQCSGLIPYQQHLEGITHLKKARRAESESNSIQMNGNISKMQVSNFNEVKNSEKTENMFKMIVNGSYQNDTVMSKNDFVLPELNDKFNTISNDELDIAIVLPEEKISFDEIFNSKVSANKQPDGMEGVENFDEFGKEKVSENTQFGSIKEGENGSAISLPKIKESIEKEAYETCKLCNISLIDKESAKEHFESKEHIEKRWGMKV